MAAVWEAFEDSDDGESVTTCNEVTAALVIHLRRERSIWWKRVRLMVDDLEDWTTAVEARHLQVITTGECDVVIWDGISTMDMRLGEGVVVPGGYWIFPTSMADSDKLPLALGQDHEKDYQTPTKLCSDWCLWERPPCKVALETCPWLPTKKTKQKDVPVSAVPLSATEREQHRILDSISRSRIVEQVRSQGYCVIPGLLCQKSCLKFGQAILDDMHTAAEILNERSGADLYHPVTTTGTYREISLREDCRLDLRNGPTVQKVRDEMPHFFRQHPDIVSICESLMFPSDPVLASGNYGKYNFAGTQQERLSIGPVGGIVSLPGCADQAIHADTPHLFEVGDHLPPHYINVFAGAIPSAAKVGPTAFLRGSHRREYVAEFHVNDALRPEIWKDLARPRLEVGDVVIFDCRILHFGLANTHPTIERPLLYTNITAHWFHDPKNWNDQEPIFGSLT